MKPLRPPLTEWWWIAFSLVAALGIATVITATTPPVDNCGATNCCDVGGYCNTTTGNCTCISNQWHGVDCCTPVCHPACQHHGVCTTNHLCECHFPFGGPDCTQPLCEYTCLHGGFCQFNPDGVSTACNCSLTDYVGVTCQISNEICRLTWPIAHDWQDELMVQLGMCNSSLYGPCHGCLRIPVGATNPPMYLYDLQSTMDEAFHYFDQWDCWLKHIYYTTFDAPIPLDSRDATFQMLTVDGTGGGCVLPSFFNGTGNNNNNNHSNSGGSTSDAMPTSTLALREGYAFVVGVCALCVYALCIFR